MTPHERAKSILPCWCGYAMNGERASGGPNCPRCSLAPAVAAALRDAEIDGLEWAKEAVYETDTIDGAALDELEDRIAARIAELKREAEHG